MIEMMCQTTDAARSVPKSLTRRFVAKLVSISRKRWMCVKELVVMNQRCAFDLAHWPYRHVLTRLTREPDLDASTEAASPR
jgi:hypothetical protein